MAAIGRVRVACQPLTDYQRYRFAWGIPGNIAAGEDIRVLDVSQDDYGLPLTGTDWWMFDESRIVHLNFRAGRTGHRSTGSCSRGTPALTWSGNESLWPTPYCSRST